MSSLYSRPSAVANPVAALPQQYGQSVWLDFIRRSLIASGELKRMVDEDGLGGVTSNPAIFEKAIDGSDDYATRDRGDLARTRASPPKAVYERLAIKDIQDAADVLRPVYDRTKAQRRLREPGGLARPRERHAGTLDEARRLWKTVSRPNVMIKVPATPEGIPAIRTLIAEGINVNVTLLFAREAYEAVAHAYIDGLEARAAEGPAPRPRGQRGQLLREPHRQRGRRAARGEAEDGDRSRQGRGSRRSWARWRSPTPSSPTRATRRSSPARAGRRWRRRARRRSACSGPAPAPRTRATATCSTSRS